MFYFIVFYILCVKCYIVTLDKQILNIEIVKKYKDLLGEIGRTKEYYFNINDRVIEINKEDLNNALNKVVKNRAKAGI